MRSREKTGYTGTVTGHRECLAERVARQGGMAERGDSRGAGPSSAGTGVVLGTIVGKGVMAAVCRGQG